MKIFLEDIADKMEEASEEWLALFNIKTGEIVDVGRQYYGIAEELREDEEIPAHLAGWKRSLQRER